MNLSPLATALIILTVLRNGHDNRCCTPADLEECRKLLFENLKFIEERCYKAYGLWTGNHTGEDISGANKADSLLVEVMEHLAAGDFRVLREYKGKSSLKRYLEVVICNKVVDLYRRKEGRGRAADEARRMGEVGIRLYELVHQKGLPVEEAHIILKAGSGYTGDLKTLEEMADRIGSKRVAAHKEVSEGALPLHGPDGESGRRTGYLRVLKDDCGQITIPDEAPDPELALLEDEKEGRKSAALKEIVQSLTPEERLMVKLKYVDGKEVRHIARAIGCTEKNTYRKLDNMLKRCRGMLFKKGLKTEDLL
jgi:RNA polymerase sigma factor (sigma-70 family)